KMAERSQPASETLIIAADIQSSAVPAAIDVDKSPSFSQSRDYVFLAAIAALVSISSLIFYYRHNAILLYGDAVAHINIARRVFDSRTPGFFQLGTVWLPLAHLLMIPFLLSDSAWQTGVGGSVPSLIAYVLSVVGVFRLVRRALSFPGEPDLGTRLAAW